MVGGRRRVGNWKESLFLSRGQMGERWGGGWVQRIEICWRDACVIFSPRQWPSSTSPCGVSSAVSSQGLAGDGWENRRKSDPYGGTIKLTADLQASSKPGQDFITNRDWHRSLTPGRCALNFSILPQQHQWSAGLQRCLSNRLQRFLER